MRFFLYIQYNLVTFLKKTALIQSTLSFFFITSPNSVTVDILTYYKLLPLFSLTNFVLFRCPSKTKLSSLNSLFIYKYTYVSSMLAITLIQRYIC